MAQHVIVKNRDKFQSQVIYDPENGIFGQMESDEEDEEGLSDDDVSILANGPFLIQVDTIPVGTTAIVEMKIHLDGEYVQSGSDLNSTNTPFIGIFDGARPNYVRVRRTEGDGDYKAYCQL